ncbi:MAG: hypothetical protein ACYC99_02865 [Candidatus Geothermincolia bacterium]
MAVDAVKKLEYRIEQLAGEFSELGVEVLAISASGMKTGRAARSAWRKGARKVSRRWRGGGDIVPARASGMTLITLDSSVIVAYLL